LGSNVIEDKLTVCVIQRKGCEFFLRTGFMVRTYNFSCLYC